MNEVDLNMGNSLAVGCRSSIRESLTLSTWKFLKELTWKKAYVKIYRLYDSCLYQKYKKKYR